MGLEVLLCSQLSSTLFNCHIIHIKQRHLVQTDSFEESPPPSVIVEVAFVPRLNDHLTAAGHQLPLTHTFACIEATYMWGVPLTMHVSQLLCVLLTLHASNYFLLLSINVHTKCVFILFTRAPIKCLLGIPALMRLRGRIKGTIFSSLGYLP